MWKMRIHYRIVALLSTIVILLTASGIGSAWTETRITTNTYEQTNPSIWRNNIVWEDTRNGGNDIYLQNLTTKVQTRVTKGVETASPCVSGNKIVWQDKRNGNWDIYMYEVSSKTTTRITLNTSDQTNPSVYGNLIAWEDTRNGGHDIYLQDLSTKKQTRVTSSIDAFNPTIYDDIAYITEDSQGVAKIMLYNISTKNTTTILSSGMIPFSLSIYGKRIIYNDMYTGMYTGLYDFGTKKSVTLPFTYVENPYLYDKKIVFQDSRNGNSDIYMITL